MATMRFSLSVKQCAARVRAVLIVTQCSRAPRCPLAVLLICVLLAALAWLLLLL